jgi:hypothetical protein
MRSTEERINEIKQNGYQLDFGTVFEAAFENYKKIVWYAGLMLLVFMVLFWILMAAGVLTYIGIDKLETFNKDLLQYTNQKEQALNFVLPLYAGIIVLSGIINPFMTGFYKMADCGQKGEEFHVSTMFTFYKPPYFISIFIATLLLSSLSYGISILFQLADLKTVGSLISMIISFFTFMTIPLIVFGNLNAIESIKSSIIIVSKQPLVLLGLLIVAIIAAILGIFGFCLGVFFTIPFVYSMCYTIYFSIIGNDIENKL